jgi:phospholipid/cholesterol/gamma-HCH transport system ATP-binding protein
MISHDIPDVFFISDRILILYDGQIIFQGTYDALDQLEHPMVDEFVKSLEGFQDELTGLYSKRTFTNVYEKAMSQKAPEDALTVAMFTVDDLDGLSEHLGHIEAQEIIQSLAEYVNEHFGEVGISNRIDRDKIATILPFTNRSAAERLLEAFARELYERGLADICAEAHGDTSSEAGFTFRVLAGLAEGTASEDIDVTSERAKLEQREIGRFQCRNPQTKKAI